MKAFLMVLMAGLSLVAQRAAADPHVPYALKMCSVCHVQDASGTSIPDQFVKPQPDMCYQCHDNKSTGSTVHPALLMGDCTMMCHNPHESAIKPLLKMKPRDLCVSCHTAPGIDQSNKHMAVEMVQSCVRCHTPHSGDLPKLLRKETPQLCVYCHADIGKGLSDPANVIHPAVLMGCQNCHEPHGSPNNRLLKMDKIDDVCFQCHDKTAIQGKHPISGHPLDTIPDKLYPEREFSCISCHKPHFSRNENLIRYDHGKDTPYGGNVCAVCHFDKYLQPPYPPRPKWGK